MRTKRSAIVIGGAGFLGTYICKHLLEKDWQVVSVGRGHTTDAKLVHHAWELPDSRLSDLLIEQKPGLCIHCAGRASVAMSVVDPLGDFHCNAVLTATILDTIRRSDLDCAFLTISSASVYGNPERLPIREEDFLSPVSSYGYHKYVEELLCREYATLHGLKTAALRVFSAYGAGLRRQVVWDIACKIREVQNGIIKLRGTGSESRDFVNAQDVALAVEAIISKGPLRGEAYNVAAGVEVPIRDLALKMIELSESNSTIEFDGVAPDGYAHRWHADILRLKRLGFKPRVRLEDGLREVLEFAGVIGRTTK